MIRTIIPLTHHTRSGPGARTGSAGGEVVRQQLTQADLLSAIVAQALRTPDHPVTGFTRGEHLVALKSRRLGLATLVSTIDPGVISDDAIQSIPPGSTAHALAARLLEPGATNTNLATLAMSAINSLLAPPQACSPAWGQDVLVERGRNKNVAIIGHFPFVEEIREAFANFWVLEKRPQPGDHDASMAGALLPQADLVAITGTTLLNGTLAEILNLCSEEAFLVLIGPTTPFAPCLFELGIDVLAGCDVTCPDQVQAGITAGRCFRELAGARQLAWEKPEANA